MNYLDAIFQRKSMRKFIGVEILPELLERIGQRFMEAELLIPLSYIERVMSDYCTHEKRAPYYLGIYTDGSKDGWMNAGYVIQQVSLYLTAIGIGSCCMAGDTIFPKVNESGNPLAITLAFGFTDEDVYRPAEKARRKNMQQLCKWMDQPMECTRSLLEAARMAPLALNRQPWRFVVYERGFHVFVTRKSRLGSERLWYVNQGIVIANIDIAATEQDIKICRRVREGMASRRYKHLDYVCSISVSGSRS